MSYRPLFLKSKQSLLRSREELAVRVVWEVTSLSLM